MHTFNLKDSQILLGLTEFENSADRSCDALIAACTLGAPTVPTAEEFAAAFNKFLYLSMIVVDSNQVALANLGRDIVNNAKRKADVEISSAGLAGLIYKELSVYKLKSMCNRSIWTQEQYQQAIDVHHNNFKS